MSFILLTLPNVVLRTSTIYEEGTLSLECLFDDTTEGSTANAAPGSLDPDVTLAVHLNDHSFALNRGEEISLVIAPSGKRTYTFRCRVREDKHSEKDNGTDGEKNVEKSAYFDRKLTVRVVIPPPTANRAFIAQDIETFDHVLMQYADLSWSYGDPDVDAPTVPPPLPPRPTSTSPPSPSLPNANIGSNVNGGLPVANTSLRGRLVLMDDANGEVVGELPQQLNITEDPALRAGGLDAPVMLELHPDMYDACTGARPLGAEGEELLGLKEVFARAVPPEEQDWVMKSATLVSQAISTSTSLLLSGVTTVSNFYIAHSSPGTPRSGTPGNSGTTSPTGSVSPTDPPSASSSVLGRAYTLSGQAARTSSRTADAVEGMIRRAVGGKPKTNTSSPPPLQTQPSSVSHSPPPAYAVYTPKHRPSRSSDRLREKEQEQEEEASEPRPLRTHERLLLSANLVLTTVDDSARRMFEVGSDRLGAVVGHKFGADAQRSTHLATHTARNIVLVYVDVRGFARRALITKTGKEFVKARFAGKNGGVASASASGTATPGKVGSPVGSGAVTPAEVPGAWVNEKT